MGHGSDPRLPDAGERRNCQVKFELTAVNLQIQTMNGINGAWRQIGSLGGLPVDVHASRQR